MVSIYIYVFTFTLSTRISTHAHYAVCFTHLGGVLIYSRYHRISCGTWLKYLTLGFAPRCTSTFPAPTLHGHF